MHGSLTERITRSLAYMLRHQPEEFDLELDEQGYGEIGDVVCALNERLGEPIDEDDLVKAIEGGDRPRYEIVDDSIRALYGHSIKVEAGEGCEPPELLYVGVGDRDARRAEEHGLQGGRRTYLHLATSFEEAKETGRRVSRNYSVITVYALDAWEDGVQFYDRKSLFLSDPIQTEYLEVGESFDDGEEPMRGGGRGMRGRGPRGREGRGRRGADRPRGRGRRFEEEDRSRDSEGQNSRPARDEERGRSDSQRDDRDSGRREERSFADTPSRRPEPQQREEAPRKPERKQAAPAKKSEGGGGFGLGIFQADKPVEESRAAEEPKFVEDQVAPETEVEELVELEPIVEPEEERSEDSDAESESIGGFGAGIIGG